MVTALTDKERVIWLKLCNVKGLGPVKLLKLFSIFNNIEKMYEATDSELLKTRIFNEARLKEWNRLKEASDESFRNVIRDCVENNIRIVPLIDKNYPKQLLNIPYSPTTLFLKGNIGLLNSEIIAMVGSRDADKSALNWTYKTAKELANSNITVISGGAVGIDTAAHTGAIEATGKTICVLGSGLLKPFPEENNSLFNKISEKGLLISEHLPSFPGSRFALLQRNRITSGLALAVILCASKLAGGAMVQTKIAHLQRIQILCPSLSLNLYPNEGIRFAKEKYDAREIESGNDVLNFLQKTSQDYSFQQKLSKAY
ncbi:DNA-protecting protein DprA [Candidatus Woesearchaeota archaeon]|nr:DNA-protecting protein DprA [Candidatus Woesearchaeota archaeon]